MWARKRLDVGWGDLAFGWLQCAWPYTRNPADSEICRAWVPSTQAFVCLSVRSGFDLLLTALKLPAESEIVFSAINIPDLGWIAERHGLKVVPADVDGATFHATIDALRSSTSPRTRMIVIAHLFGGRAELEEIAAFARRYGILLVEDCAQAFRGRDDAGDPSADVSMFSFGPIKTATALGGATLRVKDPHLLATMRKLQEGYPEQTRSRYFARIAKYAVLKLLTQRAIYGSIVWTLRSTGRDHDSFVYRRLRGFGNSPDALQAIRKRPCVPLRRMLERRITEFDESELAGRSLAARRLASGLARLGVAMPAYGPAHTYWVFPYRTARKRALAVWLLAHGYDIVQQSSLVALQPTSADARAPSCAMSLVQELAFLPAYKEMPEHELDRLAHLVAEFEALHATCRVDHVTLRADHGCASSQPDGI